MRALGLDLGLQRRRRGAPSPYSGWWSDSAYADMAWILDFENDRYALPAPGQPAGTMISATRAEAFAAFTAASTTTRTYTDGAGVVQASAANAPRLDYATGKRQLRLDGISKTNLLLNTTALSTQSLTVTAQVYTLSFYGTGTITLSGAYYDALVGTGANNRVSMVFFPSAGSLTFTVSGSVTNAQFETGWLSPYIPSSGTAGVRAGETFRLPSSVETICARTATAFVVRGQNHLIAQSVMIGTNRANSAAILRQNSARTLPVTESPGTALVATGTAISFDNAFAVGVGHDGAGRYISANGSAAVGSDAVVREAQTQYYVGKNSVDASSPPGDGWYSFICGLAAKPTSARQHVIAAVQADPAPGYVVPAANVPSGSVAASLWPSTENPYVSGRLYGWKGRRWLPNNARAADSIVCYDDDTIVFKIKPGDQAVGGYPDSIGTERNKIAEDNASPIRGITSRVQYEGQICILPGDPNTANWVQPWELHENGPAGAAGIAASVCELALYAERFAVNIYFNTTGTNPGNATPWTMPADLIRGKFYKIKWDITPNPFGASAVKFWFEDVLVVDYTGKAGCINADQTQIQLGAYRGNSPSGILQIAHRSPLSSPISWT